MDMYVALTDGEQGMHVKTKVSLPESVEHFVAKARDKLKKGPNYDGLKYPEFVFRSDFTYPRTLNRGILEFEESIEEKVFTEAGYRLFVQCQIDYKKRARKPTIWTGEEYTNLSFTVRGERLFFPKGDTRKKKYIKFCKNEIVHLNFIYDNKNGFDTNAFAISLNGVGVSKYILNKRLKRKPYLLEEKLTSCSAVLNLLSDYGNLSLKSPRKARKLSQTEAVDFLLDEAMPCLENFVKS